jgi:chromosome segregation ATPase
MVAIKSQIRCLTDSCAALQQENDCLRAALSAATQLLQGKVHAANAALALQSYECAELLSDLKQSSERLQTLQTCLDSVNAKSVDLSAKLEAKESEVIVIRKAMCTEAGGSLSMLCPFKPGSSSPTGRGLETRN